jgi:8-oxo-dGTP pyrophosphatase MutT (NUDIX family)
LNTADLMIPGTIDAFYRTAYRMAYPAWQFYLQRFRKSRTQGAQVAVWNRDRVLLIRNSYRKTYAFPGGYIRSGENTAAAASRELYEETGISIPTERLSFAFACTYSNGKHEGYDDIYECRLENKPVICIDNREVVDGRFVTPARALALPLEKHVRHYLSPKASGSVSTPDKPLSSGL